MSKKSDTLMGLFLEESYRKFSLREAARIAGVNPMTASKYLEDMAKAGMLRKEEDRNYVLFSADTESIAFRDLKRYHNVEKIRSSGLVGSIEKELDYPEAVVLFGSFSKAENDKGSDIDLFVLSESKKKPDLSVFERKLGCGVQLFLCSRNEFEAMKKGSKELLNNILNGVVLSGFLEVFR